MHECLDFRYPGFLSSLPKKVFRKKKIPSVGEQCHSEIFHDELVLRSEIERALEDDDPFLSLPGDRISPSEISEDFRIVRKKGVRPLQKRYPLVKISSGHGNVSRKVHSRRRILIESLRHPDGIFGRIEIPLEKVDVRKLLIKPVILRIGDEKAFDERFRPIVGSSIFKGFDLLYVSNESIVDHAGMIPELKTISRRNFGKFEIGI